MKDYRHLPLEQRVKFLKENASDVQNEEYEIELDEHQLNEIREKLVDEILLADKKEEELKAHNDVAKTEIKAIKELVEQRKKAVKDGFLEAKGDLYYMPNIEEKKTYVYNTEGLLIRVEELTKIPMFKGNGQPYADEKDNVTNEADSFGEPAPMEVVKEKKAKKA